MFATSGGAAMQLRTLDGKQSSHDLEGLRLMTIQLLDKTSWGY